MIDYSIYIVWLGKKDHFFHDRCIDAWAKEPRAPKLSPEHDMIKVSSKETVLSKGGPVELAKIIISGGHHDLLVLIPEDGCGTRDHLGQFIWDDEWRLTYENFKDFCNEIQKAPYILQNTSVYLDACQSWWFAKRFENEWRKLGSRNLYGHHGSVFRGSYIGEVIYHDVYNMNLFTSASPSNIWPSKEARRAIVNQWAVWRTGEPRRNL